MSLLFEKDEITTREIEKNIKTLKGSINDLELRALFQDPQDKRDAILTIHPGAGGTESCDWAEMLLRMYIRYLERKGMGYKILDFQPGLEAGIKEATLEVKGDNAYGLLKAEIGIHRLVRVSPFDASHRRHTSFASVFVYPEPEEVEIKVEPQDLKVDTFRASGHGGQHVNVTDSAVRITHIPTGITVSCQQERSQYQNRQNALRILRARLYNFYKGKQREDFNRLEKIKTEIAWGHQIRSYVLFPYRLVKDHRTGFETSKVEEVLDGDLDGFIHSYLLKEKR